MEREIEIKLLGLEIEELENNLIKRGAQKIGEEYQENITVNSTSHPIAKEQGYLRMRMVKRQGQLVQELTFKEQISNLGVRDNIEHTTLFSNREELLEILRCLGYDSLYSGKKHRISYQYKNVRFDLDTWDKNTYPYPYAEVEGKDFESIYEALESLNIDKKYVSTLSIAEMIEQLSLDTDK